MMTNPKFGVTLSFRVDLETADRLREVADIEDRQVGSVARRMVIHALKTYDPQVDPARQPAIA